MPELSTICNVDVALIPVGGDNLTMNITEAAELANTINPIILIPMHFDLEKRNELQELKNLLSKDIKMQIMNSKQDN